MEQDASVAATSVSGQAPSPLPVHRHLLLHHKPIILTRAYDLPPAVDALSRVRLSWVSSALKKHGGRERACHASHRRGMRFTKRGKSMPTVVLVLRGPSLGSLNADFSTIGQKYFQNYSDLCAYFSKKNMFLFCMFKQYSETCSIFCMSKYSEKCFSYVLKILPKMFLCFCMVFGMIFCICSLFLFVSLLLYVSFSLCFLCS